MWSRLGGFARRGGGCAASARRCTALAQAEKETEDAAAAAHLDGLGQV